MRSRPASARAGSGRWLVSYADLVTLLFALFAMLYAMSALDRERLGGLAEGMRSAFGTGAPGPLPIPLSREPGQRELRTRASRDQLERLQRELARRLEGRARVSLDAGGLRVNLSGSAFGERAELSSDARELLDEIARALRGYAGPVHVVARAEDWSLAASRSSAVCRRFALDRVLPAEQLAAVARVSRGQSDADSLELWLPREFATPTPDLGETEALRRLLDQLPPATGAADPA